MSNNKVLVQRETYESKGKEYFAYYVKGMIKNHEVKA